MYKQAESDSPLREVIRQFRAPVRYAFGYGSGVFKQDRRENGDKPLVDLILAVTHANHWHSINIQQNPHHYSGLRFLGSTAVTQVQEHLGAGVYFNAYVEINGTRLKYGVVSLSTLCSDLVNWDTLYLAGRMQKPIMVLKQDAVVGINSQVNLTNAVRLALLMLPETFTEEEFFRQIVSFSYTGDPRMRLGEHPNKIPNIVRGQYADLQAIYRDILGNMSNVTVQTGPAALHQDLRPETQARMLRHLPGAFFYRLTREFQKRDPSVFATPAVLLTPGSTAATLSAKAMLPGNDFESLNAQTQASLGMAGSAELSTCLLNAVTRTVRRPALTQSLKGLLTAGLARSARYSLAKFRRSRML
ncbi:Mitochondrial translocator assembly and maintenance protein 41 [Tieghemiomyces parasiticus]|uniref:Phosphatidate cytidylyltransferase, mitochondrial n=1 Tax=Tieghemiomyces parasiticus TaxID=78921 RepID=A0A9W7ZJQ1_9FUNG|nr:Mitochondrial translocator assembly and maintenance protein 41 [Tieghemiomyces parasiticus]